MQISESLLIASQFVSVHLLVSMIFENVCSLFRSFRVARFVDRLLKSHVFLRVWLWTEHHHSLALRCLVDSINGDVASLAASALLMSGDQNQHQHQQAQPLPPPLPHQLQRSNSNLMQSQQQQLQQPSQQQHAYGMRARSNPNNGFAPPPPLRHSTSSPRHLSFPSSSTPTASSSPSSLNSSSAFSASSSSSSSSLASKPLASVPFVHYSAVSAAHISVVDAIVRMLPLIMQCTHLNSFCLRL
jgi:hypothetical protein